MPGLFGDAAEYGRGLLAAYDKWPGLAGLLGMPSAAEQIAQAGQAAQGKPLNDRGAVQAFLDSPVAMMMSTDPIRRVANPIRAYHASPHSFDSVDLSRVGTGQGAQSYGHGFYAAESPAVSGRGGAYDHEFTAKRLGKYDLNQAESRVLKMLGEGKSEMEILTDLGRGGASFDEASQILESIKANKSHIYDLNIHADPARFLDWDKPLSRQAPEAQDVLRKFGFEYDAKGMNEFDDALLAALSGSGSAKLPKQPANPLGANIYESPKIVPGGFRDPRQASASLAEAGIPGIRYLDQGSRGGGGPGTSNYVVFDPSIIEIMRKYGIAAPVATAATGGLLGDGY